MQPADTERMETFLLWISAGLAAIFFAACVVAWWEHLGRARKMADEPDWESPAPKAVSVDVELDALAGPAPAGDVPARQQALGGALTRMAGSGETPRWIETAPMILAGSTERRRRTADSTEAAKAE